MVTRLFSRPLSTYLSAALLIKSYVVAAFYKATYVHTSQEQTLYVVKNDTTPGKVVKTVIFYPSELLCSWISTSCEIQ